MMKRIALDRIYGNPDQPRKTFDDAALRELAASIRENGLKQPITVRPAGDRFMIVMGERRFRAHQILAEQGHATDILCQVVKVDDGQLAIDAIIENDQRVDIAPLEQARSYQRMIDDFGYSAETLAQKIGKAPHRIHERLRLLKLTEECQFLLARDQITPTHAWYLSELSPAGQAKLLRAISSGQALTPSALKTIVAAIKDAEAQVSMFGASERPTVTQADVSAAKGFEARVEQVAAMLRAGIDDNVITAVKKVNPGRAATLADVLAQMQKDVKRLEDAMRAVAAVQLDMAA